MLVGRLGVGGSQGTAILGKSWFDRVLLPVLYIVRTLTLTDVQTPFLGAP